MAGMCQFLDLLVCDIVHYQVSQYRTCDAENGDGAAGADCSKE